MIASLQKLLLLPLLISLIGCNQKEKVNQYIPTETYPEDTLLPAIRNKRAAVVTAHDDDICIMSGTIAKLHKEGWEIISICFSDQLEIRNTTHVKAAMTILDSVIFIRPKEGKIRYDLDTTNKAHEAIPKNEFENIFNYPVVKAALTESLNDFSPSVVFTLDNEIGGYGHPGHVFISQLVLDMAIKNEINPDLIYQGVYTNHMEESIIGDRLINKLRSMNLNSNNWDNAKSVYGVSGMPEPNVQIIITDVAEAKMNYLRSYSRRERKNIDFYIPAFDQYEANEYFKMFNREFFRVIRLD